MLEVRSTHPGTRSQSVSRDQVGGSCETEAPHATTCSLYLGTSVPGRGAMLCDAPAPVRRIVPRRSFKRLRTSDFGQGASRPGPCSHAGAGVTGPDPSWSAIITSATPSGTEDRVLSEWKKNDCPECIELEGFIKDEN